MDDLPVSPPCNALTAEHLRSTAFQKLNKDLLIQDYIYGQKLHIKAYAAEGRAIFSTWGPPTPEKPAGDLGADTRFGFDTPVLKPRVAQASDKSPDKGCLHSTAGDDEGEQNCPKGTQERHQQSKVSMKEAKDTTLPNRLASKFSAQRQITASSPTIRTKPALTKRKVSADADEEYVARLDERRERKRTKRAIVKPAEQPITDDEDDDEPFDMEGGKKRKGKKTKNSKLQAGFALMHGFSATNVGQKRLTVKPPTVGVFIRGKASVKTSITKKKPAAQKGAKNALFSESKFLNKSQTVATKRRLKRVPKRSSSSESSSGSGCDTSSIIPKKYVITNRSPPRLPKSTNHSKPDEKATSKRNDDFSDAGLSKATENRNARTESEIWDIELQDPTTTSIPAPASHVTGPHPEDGTVVLNTHALGWAGSNLRDKLGDLAADIINLGTGQPLEGCKKTVIKTCPPDLTPMIPRSPSLGPSDSASKVGLRGLPILNNPAVGDSSKYFAQKAPKQLATGITVVRQVSSASSPGHIVRSQAVPLGTPMPHDAAGTKIILDATDDTELLQATGSLADTYEHGSSPIRTWDHDLPRNASSPNSIERALQNYEKDSFIPYHHVAASDYERLDGRCRVDERHSHDNSSFDMFDGNSFPCDDAGELEEDYRCSELLECVEMDTIEEVDEQQCMQLDIQEPFWGSHGPGIDWANLDYCQVHRYETDDENNLNMPLQYELSENSWTDGEADNWEGDDGQPNYYIEGDSEFRSFQSVHPASHLPLESGTSDPTSSYLSTSDQMDDSEEGSVLNHRFSQGRAILLGLMGQDLRKVPCVSTVEADVVKTLTGHWRPHRL